MSDWTKTTLGEISKIVTGPFGSQLHSYEYVGSGTPVIMPQNIDDRTFSTEKVAYINDETAGRLKRYVVIENDIVYSRRGDIEKHAFISKEQAGAICGTGCFRVRVESDDVYPLFLSLYLNRPEIKLWLVQHAVGSNMPNLNTGILENVPIAYPDMPSQRSISSVLSKIDRKIALNNAINAELESTARLLYDYWFTQFAFPDTNGKPYKSSGGEMVWNEQLKRDVPVGWDVKRLGSLGDFQNGVNYSKDEDGFREVKIVNVRDISAASTFIDIEKCDAIALDPTIVDRFTIYADDLLIARSGIPGSVRLIFDTPNKVIYCGFSIRFSLANKKLKNYVFFALKNIEVSTTKRSTGSILKNVSQDTLKDYVVAMPQDEVIEQFNAAVEPLLSGMVGMVKENEELAALRDFLLPLLMNGQVTVAAVDVTAPEAVVESKQVKKITKPKAQQTKPVGFDHIRYHEWKSQIEIAARGNVDEQTLKNIYEAMDEDDR